jgi:hypothetical protein
MRVPWLAAAAALVALAPGAAAQAQQAQAASAGAEELEGGELGSRSDVMDLEHSIGGAPWAARGSVTLSLDMKKKKVALKFASATTELSAEEARQLRAAVSEEGLAGLYRVRARVAGGWMVAAQDACSLATSRFRENLRFHIDKTGALLGFDLVAVDRCDAQAAAEACAAASIKLLSKASASIPQDGHAVPKDAVAAATVAQGPPPIGEDGKPLVQAAPSSDEGDKDKPAEEQQHFLRKYWYVFVPLALMSLFGAPEEPAAAGGAAPAGGAAAAAKKKK